MPTNATRSRLSVRPLWVDRSARYSDVLHSSKLQELYRRPAALPAGELFPPPFYRAVLAVCAGALLDEPLPPSLLCRRSFRGRSRGRTLLDGDGKLAARLISRVPNSFHHHTARLEAQYFWVQPAPLDWRWLIEGVLREELQERLRPVVVRGRRS